MSVSATPSAAALGLIEVHSWTASMVVLDRMEKAAHVASCRSRSTISTAPASRSPAPFRTWRPPSMPAAPGRIDGRLLRRRPDQQPRRPRAGRLEPPREFSPLIETDVVHFPRHLNEELLMPDPTSFAIGLIETQGLIGVIEAIDTACKTADVEVIGRRNSAAATSRSSSRATSPP